MLTAPREATNRPLMLDNETCPYCGRMLADETSSKEHVVGRNFVPKGTLNACWNVILRACHTCNNMKSELENDLSAITMQPDANGTFAREHDVLIAEARRKAQRGISRRTRKPVEQSSETIELSGRFGSAATFSFTLVAPPQPDEKRVFTLAHFQLAAFFYTLSYESITPRRGGYWPGGFFPLLMSLRTDWGNAVHRHFMERVASWNPRMIGFTADKFFRIAVRRHPTQELWSWALEWNANLRIVGFFGDVRAAEEEISRIPKLILDVFAENERGYFKGRAEVPLPEGEDKMFEDLGGNWGVPYDRRLTLV
jgi:predicted Rdx family selenoprotein